MAREKCVLFDKWCTSSKVLDFQALHDLIWLEEFKSCVPDRDVVDLNEQKVTSLSKASVLVDEFALTHKNVFSSSHIERVPFSTLAGPISEYPTRVKNNTVKAGEEGACF